MTSWNEGYVSDIPYSLGFYRETVPAHLAFVALCVGKDPGLAARPQRVLELGFGMGLGFLINAAANPATQFEGVDFNPQHVAHARGLAEAARLTNVSLREASFQDLAREAGEGQHDLDIIVLHGILTWVSADAHAAIVEIARKRLRPGGLLYVSYNCMPGWAAMVPVQRLMRENARRIVGRADQQTSASLALLKELITEGAGFFAANPGVTPRLEKLGTMDANYLAHEYLNANWFIFHFADVAAMFAEAKLSYLGSATIAENMDSISSPAGTRARLAAEVEPVFRETLRDFVSNKQFRRDVFVRGATSLGRAESNALLAPMRFALAVPRGKVNFNIPTALGEVQGKAEFYGAIADLLAERDASFAEIASLPALGADGWNIALQAMALLVHAGQVLPRPMLDEVDVAPAQRLNRVLTEKARLGRFYNYLAAPRAGSGIQASHVELFILTAINDNPNADAAAVIDAVLATMARIGSQPIKAGVAVTDPAEARAVVAAEVAELLAGKLPLWRRLGVI